MGTCESCLWGRMFTPRPDEIERFGDDVMGCVKSGFEGYTNKTKSCEFYQPKDTDNADKP